MKKALATALGLAFFSCSPPPSMPRIVFSEAQRACEVYAEQNELTDACQTLDQLLPFAEAFLQAQEAAQETAQDAGVDDAEAAPDGSELPPLGE